MLVQGMAYLAVLILAVILGVWIISRPLQRMDENENPLSLEMPTLKAKIVANFPSAKKLTRNTMYFLSDDFDRHEGFCAVSPILVHTVNYKTGEISFSFLYDHPNNQEYLGHTNLALYDSDMLMTAEITNAH